MLLFFAFLSLGPKEYEEYEENRGFGGNTEVKRNTRELENPLAPRSNSWCS